MSGKALRDYLGPEDIPIEEGSNACGEYIKCLNGRIYMRTTSAVPPYETIFHLEWLGTSVFVGRWRPDPKDDEKKIAKAPTQRARDAARMVSELDYDESGDGTMRCIGLLCDENETAEIIQSAIDAAVREALEQVVRVYEKMEYDEDMSAMSAMRTAKFRAAILGEETP